MALLDEDEIGYCRSGSNNDIDLQAVYGGRMSGRKQKDLKVNPIYNDLNHIEKRTDMTGNMDTLRVVTYETFPKERLTENGKYLLNGDIVQDKKVLDSDTNHVSGDKVVVEDNEKENKQKTAEDEPIYSKPMVKKIGAPEHLKAEVPNVNNEKDVEMNQESNDIGNKNDDDDDKDKTSSRGYQDNYGLLGYNKASNELDSIYMEIEERKVDDVEKSETENTNNSKNEAKNEANIKSVQSADLNDQESLSESLCDSPISYHKEIVTEVLVHSSAVSESGTYTSSKIPEDFMCHSFDSDLIPSILSMLPNENSDWPDLDSLVRKNGDENQNCECVADNHDVDIESPRHVRSVSDVVIDADVEADLENESKNTSKTLEENETSSMYKKNTKKAKSTSRNASVNEASSSTRTLKSILTTSTGASVCSCSSECEHKKPRTESEIQELKSVKFSEDTVFNENKSGKYKKEKFKHINLREIYRGKISSESALAKLNPLFQPDEDIDGGEEGDTNSSLTASEKLAYQLTLRNAMKLSKGKPGSLNQPSYLEQYLILKAHGLKTDNVDVEKLPETIETPAYDRLIQRTLAKERRKICVKWSFVIIIVTIITAVATTLGVYFKQGF